VNRVIRFTIPGHLPGLNEYIGAERRNKYQAAKMKRDAEERIIRAAKSQLRDVRFAKKFVQDALVNAKVLRNDGWANIEYFTDDFAVDKKCPRVEVEILGTGDERWNGD